MEQNSVNAKSRIEYLDPLRILAMLAVIVLHVSCENWNSMNAASFEFQVFSAFNSISRWGVAAFVMISGAIFLNRKIPMKVMLSRYILRLVIAYLFWSIVYSLFISGNSLTGHLSTIVQGHYHMWFIPMMIGLYLCLPFFRAIVRNARITRYFLLLSLAFAFVVPYIVLLVSTFGSEPVKKAVSVLNGPVSDLNLNIVAGYASYFILGYYLNNTDIKKSLRILIYVLGILSFVSVVLLNSLASVKTQSTVGVFSGDFSLNTLLEAAALFLAFKYGKCRSSRPVTYLSKCCFGAYLVHALVIEQTVKLTGLNTLSFYPLLSVPVISLIVFIVSFSVSALINRIPFINKYIV